LIALAALAVALFSAPPRRAQAPEHSRMKGVSEQQRMVDAVLHLEQEIMDAIRDRDVKALEGIMGDDFVYHTPEAEISRADFLASIRALPGRILSVEGTGLRVKVYGETAVLTGVQRTVLRTDNGAEHESRVAFTDVFFKRRGRWQLALAHGVDLPLTSAGTARQQ
jgi:ketosteroid isomerase-like protein